MSDSKPTNPKDVVGIRKAPMSVLPMGPIAEAGLGLLEGGCKYGRHNYRGAGVRASVYYDAAMRHLIAFWEGEDIDPDSGLPHVTKAMCSLLVLRDAQMQGMCEDDRPPRSASFYPELNRLAGEVIDRHVDKNPKHWTIADSRSGAMSKVYGRPVAAHQWRNHGLPCARCGAHRDAYTEASPCAG